MSDEEYIRKAPVGAVYVLERHNAFIESAPEHLKERLKRIMREKELL